MRLLIIALLAAGFLLTGLSLPQSGSRLPAGHFVAAFADDDDGDGGGGGGGGGGDDDDGDDDDGDDDDGDDDDGDDDEDDGGIGGGFDQRDGGYDAAREILAVNADPALIGALEAEGFERLERRALSSLQVSVTRLTIPPALTLPAALARARQVAPGAGYEPNPVYRIAATTPEPAAGPAEASQPRCSGPDCYALDMVGWPSNSTSCGAGMRIGMADTSVDPEHPALRGRDVERRRFAPAGIDAPSPNDHGTAVAALLVGNPDSGFVGMLPSASLFAADVFHVDRSGQPQATLADLVNGLNWLAEQRVSVINMSMTGPPNPLLEIAVNALDRRGIGVVSAAGNGGPAAAPAFPAAYDSVVSVTAVDQGLRPYRLANQGDYIALASPGVEVWSAAEGGAGRYRTGTSVAAAHVTAAIAEIVGAGNDVDAALRILRTSARDLGSPGRDRVFGWGLLQTSPNCGG